MTRLNVVPAVALLLLAGTNGAAQEAVKPVSLKDLPPWLHVAKDSYRVDPYITAAAALQAEPKTAADTLKKLIKDATDRDDAEKAIILCRMLFTAKPKGKFRRPMIGAPAFLNGEDTKDWPLEPIEVVDGVPFLIVRGYFVAGVPEPASKYLAYCLAECDWTSEKYKPKDKEAKEKALAKLLADKRWKEELTKDDKEFLSSQLK